MTSFAKVQFSIPHAERDALTPYSPLNVSSESDSTQRRFTGFLATALKGGTKISWQFRGVMQTEGHTFPDLFCVEQWALLACIGVLVEDSVIQLWCFCIMHSATFILLVVCRPFANR